MEGGATQVPKSWDIDMCIHWRHAVGVCAYVFCRIPIAVSIILKSGIRYFILVSLFDFTLISVRVSVCHPLPFADSITPGFSLLPPQVPLVLVDSVFYGKLTFPTLNILLYNVFSSGGGSHLYGKESPNSRVTLFYSQLEPVFGGFNGSGNWSRNFFSYVCMYSEGMH